MFLLKPTRSAPKAMILCEGRVVFRSNGWPRGSTAIITLLDAGTASVRVTGRANCKPAAAMVAAGCQGSCVPVVNTPPAPAAAATRMAAPMFSRFRRFSNKITGACGLWFISWKGVIRGLRAKAITPVGGGIGES